MTYRPRVDVVLELEPVVKLTCWAEGCRFNLLNMIDGKMAACNLKQVTINSKGQCEQYEPKEVK